MPELYEMVIWTVIEDPATLDGADIVESSKMFTEWAEDDEGKQKQEETDVGTRRVIPYYPRYTFYLHADEEGMESVLNEEKAAREDGNCLKVVMADMVLRSEEERRQAAENGEEEDEYELLDLRKVKISQIALLYATLLSHDKWYNILQRTGEFAIAELWSTGAPSSSLCLDPIYQRTIQPVQLVELRERFVESVVCHLSQSAKVVET